MRVPFEDWAETAEALAHSTAHWKRDRNVLSGDGLQQREEKALRCCGTDIRVVVFPQEVKPACGAAQQTEPVLL